MLKFASWNISSTVSEPMAKRLTEFVREQIKIRDSGSVHCEDMLQFVLNAREKQGNASER